MRHARWSLLFAVVAFVALFGAACGSSDSSVFPGGLDGGAGDDSTTGTSDGDPSFGDGQSGDAPTGTLVITPADQTLIVTTGMAVPTLSFVATLNGGRVSPVWTIDRGEIGTIGLSTGVFTPGTSVGGRAMVSANYKGNKGSTTVTVKLIVVQNGSPPGVDAGAGLGGVGGVGGEGFGGAVSDPGNKQVLLGAPAAETGLAFLYPYDNTVFPRGVLPPLLQWQPGVHGAPSSYDAVYIHITEAAFEYQGFFNKTTPTALAPTFMHHPIPQSVWNQVGLSNAGEDVTVTLIFAAGGVAYGPATEKWKIANGSLKGTVYYNSYGTSLAKQLNTNLPTPHLFGGATLAIRAGQTDPVLVAGGNGGDDKCRVCHSVSANGSTLLTQWGNNGDKETSAYNLKTGAETPMYPVNAQFAWGAPSPDGTFLFSNAAPLSGASVATPSVLYTIPAGTLIASNSPADLRAGTPAFSPDGKNVAFNWYAGAGGGDTKSLAMMTFAAPSTFGAVTKLYTPAAGVALYPSFLPTNDGVVFELETRSNGRALGETRADTDPGDIGAQGELWWLDTATKTPARLDKLNGSGYVPTGPNAHDNDAIVNYEPTVNPVPSGGYAWVVFTSRRLYGNVATINPWHSDPRFTDLTQTPTPKKLWVAAVDLHAPPGTDPSHPAFYLPAQELLAANSRGYWVVDPCKTDGITCETGDECCGGFCRSADGGGLVCTAEQPSCAQEFEKCAVTADCCGAGTGFTCIGGFCSRPTPR